MGNYARASPLFVPPGETRPDFHLTNYDQASINYLQRTDSVASIAPRTPGAFSVRLVDAQGAELADYPFTASATEDGAT